MMTEWQPIETAPKDGTRVDLWVEVSLLGAGRETDCYWDRGAWFIPANNYGDGCSTYDGQMPTHWMPIPEPPLSRNQNEGAGE